MIVPPRHMTAGFALIVAVTAGLWLPRLPGTSLPDAPESIAGLSFSPFGAGDDPRRLEFPSRAALAADVERAATLGRSLRTYAIDSTLADVPALARMHGLAVTPGIALDSPADADSDVAALAGVVEANPNVTRVIVGNEAVLTERLSAAALGHVLDAAREQVAAAVGTAEPWHIWLAQPQLARHVDFIAVHVLPYWEGVPIDTAVDFVFERVADIERSFPDKAIVLAEVGWPSSGRTRGAAVPSRANAARFVREFTARAAGTGLDYFLLEAIDQPWKRGIEGGVGAHWGLLDADRQLKFALTGPALPPLAVLGSAAASALAAGLLFVWLLRRRLRPEWAGNLLLAGTAATLVCAVGAGLEAAGERYWTAAGVIGAGVPLAGLAFAGLVLLVEAFEWAEALGTRRRRIAPPAATGRAPKVSIHVAAHAEPPAMLIATLARLAALDYPRFEVIVVDNNTEDDALYRPVEAWCRKDSRFRFFHVAPLAGYKAGALNFALRRTAADAEVVAVVDSDYQVEPDWLRDLVPAFGDPRVGVVQAPQAYRDAAESPFKTACEAEYRGFFQLGMVVRDRQNAIIQHGTMTMIRRRVLDAVGGWAEWTITEDAELGLRVLEHGHVALYTPRRYGAGLTPDTFADYKSQRFRWAFGAVQILRRHSAMLLGRAPSRLTPRQRYEFLAGWLPWLGDAANLVFSIGAVLWSAAMLIAPDVVLAPAAAISATVIALYVFRLAKMAILYRRRVDATLIETAAAALAGLSLVVVVGRAVLTGLVCREAAFGRTPKLVGRGRVGRALVSALGEMLLAAALLGASAAIALTATYANRDLRLWSVVLVLLALPPVSAILMATAGALWRGRAAETGQQRARQLAHETE